MIDQQPAKVGGIGPWLKLLHFGPSVFTAVLFGVYIAIASRGFPDAGKLLLLLGSQLAIQFSISVLNDYWDYDLDRRTKPDKPLPSGLISLPTAATLGSILGVLGIVLTAATNIGAAVWAALGLFAGLSYDYRLKRTAFSPLPFALGFGILPLWAWAGLGLEIPAQVYVAVPLIALLVLALHVADTLPDLQADKEAGLRGLAHRLGADGARFLCWGALAAGIVAAAILGILFAAQPLLLWSTSGIATLLLLAAVFIYRREGDSGLRRMAGLIEFAAMFVALGWVAATNL